jgi:hypothetical protein
MPSKIEMVTKWSRQAIRRASINSLNRALFRLVVAVTVDVGGLWVPRTVSMVVAANVVATSDSRLVSDPDELPTATSLVLKVGASTAKEFSPTDGAVDQRCRRGLLVPQTLWWFLIPAPLA